MRQNGVDECPKIRILHSDQVADTCEACDREGPCGDSLFSAKKPPAQPDEDAGSNNGDNEVCKPAKGVEAQDAGQEAANEGTDDTNDDVAKQTAVGIHDFAGNPADDGTGDEGT